MTPALAISGVSRRIGSRAILDTVSLDLHAGRLTVLIGPNGAGKSTLIGIASGYRAPDAGRVLCEGIPLRDWPRWRLAGKRAVMSQSGTVAFAFTVEDVVRIGCDGIGRGLGEPQRAAIARNAMRVADVAHLAHRDITTLSGGELQRARFARALAQLEAGASVETRQVLILDEPVSSLDLKHQIFLLDAARDLARGGMAVLAVLHDLTLARGYADELHILRDGRMVAGGPPDEILTSQRIRDVFDIDPVRYRWALPWLQAS
jgi:iron complex transport system ATP-binding protein